MHGADYAIEYRRQDFVDEVMRLTNKRGVDLILDMVGGSYVERNLKALGTFGYQTTARGNPVYIQYIPRTLRYVGDNLRSHDRLPELRRLLTKYVPELQG